MIGEWCIIRPDLYCQEENCHNCNIAIVAAIGKMKVICAWCGQLLGVKDGKGVSHGICKGCKSKTLEELNKEAGNELSGKVGNP